MYYESLTNSRTIKTRDLLTWTHFGIRPCSLKNRWNPSRGRSHLVLGVLNCHFPGRRLSSAHHRRACKETTLDLFRFQLIQIFKKNYHAIYRTTLTKSIILLVKKFTHNAFPGILACLIWSTCVFAHPSTQKPFFESCQHMLCLAQHAYNYIYMPRLWGST